MQSIFSSKGYSKISKYVIALDSDVKDNHWLGFVTLPQPEC